MTTISEIKHLYETGLSDSMMQLLEDHFENSEPLEGDLLSRLNEYIATIKTIDTSEFDQLNHNLSLISKSTKYSWDLFNIYRQILDYYLKKASEAGDMDSVENILCQYVKVFRKGALGNDLDMSLDSYFGSMESNADLNKKLEDAAKEKSLSLIIGAGLTACYVGSWDKLLNKLMVMRCYSRLLEIRKDSGKHTSVTVSEMEEFMNNHIKAFISDNVNYLERGEYLRYDSGDISKAIGSKAENRYRELFFAEQVRQTVSDFMKFTDEHGVPVKLEDKFISDSIIGKNPKFDTLSAVINLCVKQDINEIITYNFDTIVDTLIASRKVRKYYDQHAENVRVEVYSYFRTEPVLILPKGAKETWKTIKIYHVHGIVDDAIDEIQPIIFSENSYQNYQKTALNWSNIHLADIQSRNNVLCVGFSGDDPNFRSLRRFFEETQSNPVMGNAEKKSVFLMRNYADEKNKLLDPGMDPKDNDFALACIQTYFDAVISYFKEQYNVDIIWSNGFTHMAKQINRIAESRACKCAKLKAAETAAIKTKSRLTICLPVKWCRK